MDCCWGQDSYRPVARGGFWGLHVTPLSNQWYSWMTNDTQWWELTSWCMFMQALSASIVNHTNIPCKHCIKQCIIYIHCHGSEICIKRPCLGPKKWSLNRGDLLTAIGTWPSGVQLNRGGLWIQVVIRAGFTVLFTWIHWEVNWLPCNSPHSSHTSPYACPT